MSSHQWCHSSDAALQCEGQGLCTSTYSKFPNQQKHCFIAPDVLPQELDINCSTFVASELRGGGGGGGGGEGEIGVCLTSE